MTPETDEKRDKRIQTDVIVDAYTADEQVVSWCYYLEGEISFPLQVECIEEGTISSLRNGEEVPVVGTSDEVLTSSRA